MRPVVLCAPDSLKGVLAASEAAQALAEGVRRAGCAEAVELPVADGGEGTAEVLHRALGGSWREVVVPDPLGRPVTARYLLLDDGRAVVESAEAIGLPLLAPDERDPLVASSAGLAALLVAAGQAGAREIVVTLGGSATVDGGEGMRESLEPGALAGVELLCACDVRNPLHGPRGAARAFGPQKGASPVGVDVLEERLRSLEHLAPFAELPGAGAAGGLGAAFAALGAKLVPGIDVVLDAVRFRERVRAARLVVTGEGAVDATSVEGKTPAGVAAAARDAGVPCVVFGGVVRPGARALYDRGASAILPLSGRPERAREDLVELGEALARLVAALAD